MTSLAELPNLTINCGAVNLSDGDMDGSIQGSQVGARSFPPGLQFPTFSVGPLPFSFLSSSLARHQPLCLLKPTLAVSHRVLPVPLILFRSSISLPSDYLIKIVHLFGSIYVCASILPYNMRFATLTAAACYRWEFVTALDFEWEVFSDTHYESRARPRFLMTRRPPDPHQRMRIPMKP